MKETYRNILAVVVFGTAFVVSMHKVLANRQELHDPSRKTIRICHWQLEAGFRQGIAQVIEDYEELHPDVKVMQISMTDRIYGQWVNTHLIAKTAPDIVEIGYASLLSNEQYIVSPTELCAG